MKKIVIILSVFFLITGGFGQAAKSQNMESIKLKETEDDYMNSEWNYNVPNYQENRVYVRISYDMTDSMTDEELFQVSRTQIEKLKKI